MSDIIYELNGKKYLLVELPIVEDKKISDKLNADFKKYGCIFQGIKEIKTGGWFSKPYMIIKALVPEENLLAFNQ